MQALVTTLASSGPSAAVQTVPIPEPASNQILVEVKAIALNPVDALYVAKPASGLGRTVGSDFAGVIAKLGAKVPSNSWHKVGERVAGFVHGACQEGVNFPGAFAQYAIVDWDLVFKIPENIGFEEAATLPLCLNTASNGLFRLMSIPPPWSTTDANPYAGKKRQAVLIYSGSTSVGAFAIQLARLAFSSATGGDQSSKPLIIVTSSPQNASYMTSLGADFVANHRLPFTEWSRQITDFVSSHNAQITWAFDCISEGTSIENVSQLVAGGGKVAAVRGPAQWEKDNIKKDVDVEYMAAWTLLGKEFWYNGGIHFPAEPTHRALAVALHSYLSSPESPLLSGALVGNKIRLMDGGLGRVVESAFPLLGVGRVTERGKASNPISGEKLVYKLNW